MAVARKMAIKYGSTTLPSASITSASQVAAAAGRTLTFAAAGRTITASTGDFAADGYTTGMLLVVEGTTYNDGRYLLLTVATTVLTVVAEAALVNEGPLSATATLNASKGTALHLHGVHQLEKGPEEAVVRCSFVAETIGTEAAHAALCVALEAALVTRRQELQVTLNGTEVLTLNDADNSGFDVTASLRKPGGDYDTNLTRLYELTVTAGLPTLGTSGRRELEYRVSFSPSRVGTLEVAGTYTAAQDGSQASAVYLAGIVARVATITGALGGTWELSAESYTPDDQDQVVRFQRTYREIVANQSAGTLNNSALVGVSLAVTEDETEAESASDPEGVTPLRGVTIEFSADVDQDVTTDLLTMWTGTVYPHLVAEGARLTGGSLTITGVRRTLDPQTNSIRATVTAVYRGDSGVLARTVQAQDDVDYGKSVRDVWPRPEEVPDDEESAEVLPTPAHVHQGPRRILRTVTTTIEELRGAAPSSTSRTSRSVASEEADVAPAGGYEDPSDVTTVRLTRSVSVRTGRRGIRRLGATLPTVVRTTVEVFRLIVPLPAEASSGGGAAGNSAPGLGTTRTRSG